MVGMAALVWTVIELPRYGLSDNRILTGAGVAVVALVAFGIWEAKVKAPMVPLGLFRNRSFSGGSLALVLIQLGTAALMLVLPQYFQYVLGYSPTQSGMAITPMLVATILGNAVSGGLGMKFGNRMMATVGAVVVLAGFVVLAGLSPDDSYAVVATALALIGIGSGLAFPAAVAALMGAVPDEHAGVGSALNDTVQQTGATLGVAVLGTVLAGAFTSAMPQDAPGQARESISGALNLAGTGDPGLAATARDAFVNATSTTFTVACFCSLAAILTAVAMIRDRKKEEAPQPVEAEAGV
jgi:MFS transporter, DHA2 family, multidrug resistance protein